MLSAAGVEGSDASGDAASTDAAGDAPVGTPVASREGEDAGDTGELTTTVDAARLPIASEAGGWIDASGEGS